MFTGVARLVHHVVPGRAMTSGIAGRDMVVRRVQGAPAGNGARFAVMVEGATVAIACIEAKNVPAYVIDRVMLQGLGVDKAVSLDRRSFRTQVISAASAAPRPAG